MRMAAMLGAILAAGSFGGGQMLLSQYREPPLALDVSSSKRKGGPAHKTTGIAKAKRAARKAANVKRNKAHH